MKQIILFLYEENEKQFFYSIMHIKMYSCFDYS